MRTTTIVKVLSLLSLAFVWLLNCQRQSFIPYPDPVKPKQTPRLFAPQSVSLPQRFEQNIAFSPDGREYYYGTSESRQWWYHSILRTRILSDGSVQTDTPSVIKRFRFTGKKFIGEPFISPDGNELWFVVDFQPDIWVSRRSPNGEWQRAVRLEEPVNSQAGEWNPSVSSRGTLYFASTRTDSGRIYKAARVAGQYPVVERLKGPINADDAGDPCIAPDESFLVYSSMKPGGYGGTDLYLSIAQPDGTWSVPVNLGSALNTAQEEVGPRLSPDGKYLFFHRRDRWEKATASDIYWVDIAGLTPLSGHIQQQHKR